MDDTNPGRSILLFVFLLIIYIIFHGFFTAIQEMSENNLEKAEEEGNKRAAKLLKMKRDPSHLYNGMQMLLFASNILICYIVCLQYQGVALLVALVVLFFTFQILGILLPKKIAGRYCDQWGYGLVNLVYGIVLILRPLDVLVTEVTNLFGFIFGIRKHTSLTDVTEEEIISMVNEGHEQGVLQASEAEMITNIFEFGDKEAKDIMTHRKNIIALDASQSLQEAIHFMLHNNNSRYPVYEDNIDNILGIIHIKDALRAYEEDKESTGQLRLMDLKDIIMEARFIPETRNIDDLFKSMQSQKIHMVIVVDEYGQTEGLIAMEDILEEIVGNILDEYDEDETHIKERNDDSYIMEGMTTLEEVEDRLSIKFDEECDTLNGFILARLGKIPEDDEQFSFLYENYLFKILKVENRMIQLVLVKPQEEVQPKEERTKEVELPNN